MSGLFCSDNAYGRLLAGPSRSPTSHIPWKQVPGSGHMLGIDFLWGYGGLEVWDTEGKVEANLDWPDRTIRAGSPDNVYGVRFAWPEMFEAGYIYRYKIGFGSIDTIPDGIVINHSLVWRAADHRGELTPKQEGGSKLHSITRLVSIHPRRNDLQKG